MPKTVKVPVPEGLPTHDGVIYELVFREPTTGEYLDHGEIVSFVRTPDGMIIPSTDKDALRSYVACCTVSPKQPLLLDQLPLKVGREVRSAIMSFFQEETTASEPSKTSPENSSSEPTSSALPT